MVYESRIMVKCGKTEVVCESMTSGSVYWYDRINNMKEILSATADAETKRVSKSWSEDE